MTEHKEAKTCKTLSKLECTSALPALLKFLSIPEAEHVWMCSHHLRKVIGPLFVPRVRWQAVNLETLSSETLQHVQRVCVKHETTNFCELPRRVTDLDVRLLSSKLPAPLNKGPFFPTLQRLYCPDVKNLTALPPRLTQLSTISWEGEFPPTLTDLTLTRQTGTLRLPASLKKLSIFVDQLQFDFPEGLTSLDLTWVFPVALGDIFPTTLQHLTLYSPVAVDVNTLPKDLRELSIRFSREVKQTFDFRRLSRLTNLEVTTMGEAVPLLPQNLTSLTFSRFDVDLKPGDLPPKLTLLDLGFSFRRPILANVLPPSLTSLQLEALELEACLPPALTSLRATRAKHFSCKSLPNLRSLWFNEHCGVEHLPASLTDLHLGPAHVLSGPSDKVLPSRIKSLYLTLNLGDVIPAGVLPEGLTTIAVHNFNQPFTLQGPSPLLFPASLRELDLGNKFNTPLAANALGNNLTWLMFGNEFNQPLPQLPQGLTHLFLGIKFTHSLKDVLPSGLTHLQAIHRVSLVDVAFPRCLKYLRTSGTRDGLVVPAGCLVIFSIVR